MTAITTLRRVLAATAAVLIGAASYARAQDKVPAEFHGDWVPEKGTCESAVRFRVAESRLTLMNGKDSASYGALSLPQSFFGPDYQGISVVVVPEINSNDPPFTAFFNWDEKKGIARVDIHQEVTGQVHPQMRAMIERHKKLAERFPLNMVPLKKCAGK